MAKKPKRRVGVNLTLNPASLAVVDRKADKLGHSRAAMIRFIVDQWAKAARR